jgi:hypothetical protein
VVALTLAVVTALVFSFRAHAQLPPDAQINSELANRFFTHAPNPDVSHRTDVTDRIKALVMQQARAMIEQLQPWGKEPNALLVGPGLTDENTIRTNAHIAFGLAILSRCAFDGYPPGLSRKTAHDKSIAILRFLLPTHAAGGVLCNDNKHWANQWQSAFWAYSAGSAAWLLWTDLDAHQKWLAARMVCDEADRFMGQIPPAQLKDDTKAEENAWNAKVISLAFNMFPKHPHHQKWGITAQRWNASSFLREADIKANRIIDGYPIEHAVKGANIYDDYTLENHNRVHPDYMSCFAICGYQRLSYEWAGNNPPQALTVNADGVYSVLKKLAFPDGGFIYPNGQDWQLHRQADWVSIHALADVNFNDPQAAALLRISLDATEKMAARDPKSTIVSPHKLLWPATESIIVENLATTWLLLSAHGEKVAPTPEDELWRELSGKFIFENGKFAVLRSPHTVATFSWGAQVMGMVLPMQKDLLLTPYPRSLIGTITVEGVAGDPIDVQKVVLPDTNDAMAVLGILKRAGNIEQRFGFVSLLDGRTIYVDALFTPKPLKLTKLDLGPVGVLNESDWPYHNGTRMVYHDGGKDIFTATEAEKAQPVTMKSPWYNIDNVMGIIPLQAPGAQIYDPKPTAAKGRLEQVFHLNQMDITKLDLTNRGAFATTALVFYPGDRAKDSADDAKKCKLGFSTNSSVFRITLEDGSQVAIDLNDLKLTVQLKQEQ